MKTVTFDERSWQLVAINPSNAVIDQTTKRVLGDSADTVGSRSYMRALWAAVLEASPTPPPADEWWHKETLRHLPFVLQVYDDALDKAREGRKFDNPCKTGSLEFLAWILGTQRGEELGPANDVQDQRDAERMDWLDRVAHCADWLDGEPTKRVIRASDGAEFTGDTWREAIDAARASEGE